MFVFSCPLSLPFFFPSFSIDWWIYWIQHILCNSLSFRFFIFSQRSVQVFSYDSGFIYFCLSFIHSSHDLRFWCSANIHITHGCYVFLDNWYHWCYQVSLSQRFLLLNVLHLTVVQLSLLPLIRHCNSILPPCLH